MPLSPPSPPLPSPLASVFFAFSSSSTDVRTCALRNIVVMERLCLEGGTPIDIIKLADGCLSCTCLAIFWSAALDDGNIEGLQIVGWYSRGVSIHCRYDESSSLSQSFHLHKMGGPTYLYLSPLLAENLYLFIYLYSWFSFWGLQGATLIGPSQKCFFRTLDMLLLRTNYFEMQRSPPTHPITPLCPPPPQKVSLKIYYRPPQVAQ
jgi:hypothetical protein